MGGESRTQGGLTRREALAARRPRAAAAMRRASPGRRAGARRDRRDVAVLGGGMAGLAAAHELVERGFRVTVYERKALGGKARSIPVRRHRARAAARRCPASTASASSPASTTTSRTRCGARRSPATRTASGTTSSTRRTRARSRANGRADAQLFGIVPDPGEAGQPGGLERLLVEEVVKQQGIPPHEAEFFANRADGVPHELRRAPLRPVGAHVVVGLRPRRGQVRGVPEGHRPRADPRRSSRRRRRVASTRTIGNMAEAFVMNIMQRGNDGAPDRVLNAPTNEAWIDPWVALLRQLGVRFRVGQTVEALTVRARPRSTPRARATAAGGAARIEADWFVCAMPAERARAAAGRRSVLARRPVARADERPARRLDERHPVLPAAARSSITRGHVTFVDAPWALTALTQAQFWAGRDFAARLRRRRRRSTACRSTSPTGTRPGSSTASPPSSARARRSRTRSGRRSRRTSRTRGESYLPDDILHSWFLDPAIQWNRERGRNSQRRAAAGQHRRLVGEAPDGRDRDPEPLARRRLRADRHRPGDDGGRERVRPRGGQRDPATGRARRPSRRRSTSSTTRRSSRRPSARTPSCSSAGQPNALDHHP